MNLGVASQKNLNKETRKKQLKGFSGIRSISVSKLTSSELKSLSLQTSVISRYASSRLAAMKLGSYLWKTADGRCIVGLKRQQAKRHDKHQKLSCKQN